MEYMAQDKAEKKDNKSPAGFNWRIKLPLKTIKKTPPKAMMEPRKVWRFNGSFFKVKFAIKAVSKGGCSNDQSYVGGIGNPNSRIFR